jgi:gluconolactonase
MTSRFSARRVAAGVAFVAPLVWAALSFADSSAICGDCRFERAAACGEGFLEGPVMDADGRIWMVDIVAGALKRSDRPGHCETIVASGGSPNGLAIGPDGRVYLADQQRGVLAYEPGAQEPVVVVGEWRGAPLTGPNDLVFDSQGGLYVTVPRGTLFDPEGLVLYLPAGGGNADLQLIGDRLAFPNGIVMGPNGQTVLVAEMTAKRILSLPAAGMASPMNTPYVWARTQGGVGPDGMHRGDDGRVHVANLGRGEVLVYAADGVQEAALQLPEEAGTLTTNVTIGHDGWLYVTESEKGELWRVRLATD